MPNVNIDRDWDARYDAGDTPWDSGLPSREMRRIIDERDIPPGRALELGCGTGTNAIELARRGFTVTAVDCSSLALKLARDKAASTGFDIEWIEADVQNFGEGIDPFGFVFDRGCYHCCRRVDLDGYLSTLTNVTQDGSQLLILAGNADEQTEHGPPRVKEPELRNELGRFFSIVEIRAFRFMDPGEVDGPLGWSTLLKRNSSK
ncbi:MAG: class I SAM-dependent methyltransferase [Planctomycetaceae bacterium]|nr:class I SAM-dependent methyltransferase [Planctomycetaceae bacterium]